MDPKQQVKQTPRISMEKATDMKLCSAVTTKEKSGEFHHAECGSALLWQLLDLDKNNT